MYKKNQPNCTCPRFFNMVLERWFQRSKIRAEKRHSIINTSKQLNIYMEESNPSHDQTLHHILVFNNKVFGCQQSSDLRVCDKIFNKFIYNILVSKFEYLRYQNSGWNLLQRNIQECNIQIISCTMRHVKQLQFDIDQQFVRRQSSYQGSQSVEASKHLLQHGQGENFIFTIK